MTLSPRAKLWSGLIGLFLLGAVAGGAVTGMVIRHRLLGLVAGGPVRVRAAIGGWLAHELKLSDEQRANADRALEVAQRRIFAIRAQHQPELQAVLGELYDALQNNVSPEKRPRLDELYQIAKMRLSADPFGLDRSSPPAGSAPFSEPPGKELPNNP